MDDALAATEALVAAVSGRPGGRATELAVTYLRLARRPTFGAESRAAGPGADRGGESAHDMLDALSDEECELLREAIEAVLVEARATPSNPPHDDEMVSAPPMAEGPAELDDG